MRYYVEYNEYCDLFIVIDSLTNTNVKPFTFVEQAENYADYLNNDWIK